MTDNKMTAEQALIKELRNWRSERPDEWKMDEIIRLAEKALSAQRVSEKIEVRRICEKCNQDYSLPFVIGGAPMQAINHMKCPNCGERDDPWILVVGEPFAASPEPVAPSVPDAAVNDASLFGAGFFRVNPDGSTDHIPPQNVHIAISEEAQNTERCPECGMLDGHAEGCPEYWIDIPANLRRQTNVEQHSQQVIADLRAEVEALKAEKDALIDLSNGLDKMYRKLWKVIALSVWQLAWCPGKVESVIKNLRKSISDAARLREGGSE